MTHTRDTYVAGLRGLADLLERSTLPLPHEQATPFFIYDDIEDALTLRDLMPDPETTLKPSDGSFTVRISGHIEGLEVVVYVHNKLGLTGPPVPTPVDLRLLTPATVQCAYCEQASEVTVDDKPLCHAHATAYDQTHEAVRDA